MSKKHLTIGYMSNDLLLSYNYTIQQGIVKTCEKNNLHNITFLGGELNPPYDGEIIRNNIYNLVNKDIIDGLIINAATIFHYVENDIIRDFYEKFNDIPIVSIGKKILHYPSSIIDNCEGLRQGIIHLIKDHGHKRIAFIRGPESSYEAELRFSTYLEVLKECGIEKDTHIIENGNFRLLGGISAMKRLIAKNVKIDALVASNDDMALGAMGYAQEIGISVPNELAILGFDDIEDAGSSSIPLTTVRQPFFKIAEQAVLLLKDYMEQKVIPEDIILPTELIIRRSCGCFSHNVLNARIKIDKERKICSLAELKKELVCSRENTYKNNTPTSLPDIHWEEYLVESFINFMESKDHGDFLPGLDEKLNTMLINKSFDLSNLQNGLSRLINKSLPYLLNDVSMIIKAESFWHQLRILIQEYGVNSISLEKMRLERRSVNLVNVGNLLISMFDLEILKRNMLEQLPRLNIKDCYISLYDRKEGEEGYSRLILGYSGNQEEKLPARGLGYKTKNLLPHGLGTIKNWNNLIVDALYFEDVQFGFILIKADPIEVRFEAVRQQISSAIKGALLVHELKDKEVKLKKSLEEQKKQSEELQEAYYTLRDNQNKMLIIEKMASLGRMTAGLAHEMNTPLAAARASLMELESLTTEYEESIGNPGITDDDFRNITSDMKKYIHIAKNAIIHTAGFVQSVKSQTRDLSVRDCALFKVVPIIRDAIMILTHDLKKSNCTVNFNFIAEDILLFGIGGKFSQVIINLLTNAMDAYRTKGGGVIDIELNRNKTHINLMVRDNGCGIKKDLVSKIYDPLFTTKKLFQGTGLGLTIVHNIIEGIFEGTIDVESTPGEGTTFIIHFPIPGRASKIGKTLKP